MANKSRYGFCVENEGHSAALEIRKVYRLMDDRTAEARGLVRVIDESGEDYLYPSQFFVPIELPAAAVKAFRRQSA